jgi:hypothetical protein
MDGIEATIGANSSVIDFEAGQRRYERITSEIAK